MSLSSAESGFPAGGGPASRRILTAAVMLAFHALGGMATIQRLAGFTHIPDYNLYRICGRLKDAGLLKVVASDGPLTYALPEYAESRSKIRGLCGMGKDEEPDSA